MNFLILAANGQIARIVENRILSEDNFQNINLTLGLRNSHRLASLGPKARIMEVDLTNNQDVNKAIYKQEIVFVDVVDHTKDNIITKNVIETMKANRVSRVIFANILGIYNEVGGEFGRWNHQFVLPGLQAAINSDKLLAKSGLDYTTLRLPWLNDRNEIKYSITTHNEPYIGVSGSRKSIADVILKIVRNPELYDKDSIGIADPDTQGKERPVY
ncbi:putative oxidoreductase [Lactobacillus sp. wkB8]|uniref:NAD(P)H-binding protein n=1 Tax=Lactobacillus sp. wkB8 TaxID=1545702 RepID=UPI00050D18F8|nr:NAD(P)H-binding protein [Lactobacillus sp. wkB8]AIS10033.1 putative oxidoreductase [Lactobacillus sp. wkB8]